MKKTISSKNLDLGKLEDYLKWIAEGGINDGTLGIKQDDMFQEIETYIQDMKTKIEYINICYPSGRPIRNHFEVTAYPTGNTDLVCVVACTLGMNNKLLAFRVGTTSCEEYIEQEPLFKRNSLGA